METKIKTLTPVTPTPPQVVHNPQQKAYQRLNLIDGYLINPIPNALYGQFRYSKHSQQIAPSLQHELASASIDRTRTYIFNNINIKSLQKGTYFGIDYNTNKPNITPHFVRDDVLFDLGYPIQFTRNTFLTALRLNVFPNIKVSISHLKSIIDNKDHSDLSFFSTINLPLGNFDYMIDALKHNRFEDLIQHFGIRYSTIQAVADWSPSQYTIVAGHSNDSNPPFTAISVITMHGTEIRFMLFDNMANFLNLFPTLFDPVSIYQQFSLGPNLISGLLNVFEQKVSTQHAFYDSTNAENKSKLDYLTNEMTVLNNIVVPSDYQSSTVKGYTNWKISNVTSTMREDIKKEIGKVQLSLGKTDSIAQQLSKFIHISDFSYPTIKQYLDSLSIPDLKPLNNRIDQLSSIVNVDDFKDNTIKKYTDSEIKKAINNVPAIDIAPINKQLDAIRDVVQLDDFRNTTIKKFVIAEVALEVKPINSTLSKLSDVVNVDDFKNTTIKAFIDALPSVNLTPITKRIDAIAEVVQLDDFKDSTIKQFVFSEITSRVKLVSNKLDSISSVVNVSDFENTTIKKVIDAISVFDPTSINESIKEISDIIKVDDFKNTTIKDYITSELSTIRVVTNRFSEIIHSDDFKNTTIKKYIDEALSKIPISSSYDDSAIKKNVEKLESVVHSDDFKDMTIKQYIDAKESHVDESTKKTIDKLSRDLRLVEDFIGYHPDLRRGFQTPEGLQGNYVTDDELRLFFEKFMSSRQFAWRRGYFNVPPIGLFNGPTLLITNEGAIMNVQLPKSIIQRVNHPSMLIENYTLDVTLPSLPYPVQVCGLHPPDSIIPPVLKSSTFRTPVGQIYYFTIQKRQMTALKSIIYLTQSEAVYV